MIRELYLDLWFWWDDHFFGHKHKYIMARMVVYEGEPKEYPNAIPLVAWIYRCKCGKEIVELEPSGIRLLQQGVGYDELIKKQI